MECTVENKKKIKLDAVVNAAIIDMYEDTGRYFQRANFMAARGLKKLYNEALPKIKHKAWLPVNSNTHTATLPLDWDSETFVGFVDTRWHKVPLKLNNSITDTINIVDVPCESPCPKCNQDTSICNDLVITEEVNLIVINDTTYEQTIIKKLYPNGDYWLETTTPVLNIETNSVDSPYPVTREFITNFDLKPCGCLDTTPLNTANLIAHCPDIYCNYYAPCDTQCCADYGGYKIFEESGLIQMDQRYPFDKVYVEYNGYIAKIQGSYYVPRIAFECLVEYTKFKLIQNKRNIALSEREWQKQNWIRERSNFTKVNGQISLALIMQTITMGPKFDVDFGIDWYGCFGGGGFSQSVSSGTNGSNGTGGNSGNSTTIINNNTIINRTAFVLAVKATGTTGMPVPGQSTYQNNVLKGALDVEFILLAKQVLTKEDGDFSLDPATGIVDISPNQFVLNDSLIINYNKNL